MNSSLKYETEAYNYAYAVTCINVVLSYTIIMYILWVYREIDPAKDTPFHKWVWFSDNFWCNLILVVITISWFIANTILLSDLVGVGYLLMLFFVVSLCYWLTIAGMMLYSYCNNPDQIVEKV